MMEALNIICSVLQILGLLVIIFMNKSKIRALIIIIAGTAAVVKFFIPIKDLLPMFTTIVAVAGLGLIIVGLVELISLLRKVSLES